MSEYGSSQSNHGVVYALDAATGHKIWSRTMPLGVFSSPAVANGVLYTGCDNGRLYALNGANGHVNWWIAFKNDAPEQSSPAVANGVIYYDSPRDKHDRAQALCASDRKGGWVLTICSCRDGVCWLRESQALWVWSIA
jgi:eukaryotic-like serine/threonine-protein kinase